MSTLMEKLEYTHETKTKIKETIRQAGIPVGEKLEYRRYPDKIREIGDPLDVSHIFNKPEPVDQPDLVALIDKGIIPFGVIQSIDNDKEIFIGVCGKITIIQQELDIG